jgi:galactokinase
MNPSEIADRFAARFDRKCSVVARAPGRINLIGEHTDYNEGLVLPIAVERTTWAAVGMRDDRRVRIVSEPLGEEATWELDAWDASAQPHWTSYLAGVETPLRQRGARLSGFNLLIVSDVPIGGGLSSSAALEVATALALAHLAGEPIVGDELVDLCRRAEHEFAGVPCGIMDQTIALQGRAGHALLLDCRSRSVEHVPFDPKNLRLLVVDSGVRHALAQSEYARRQGECREAVDYFQRFRPDVRALRDASSAMVRSHALEMAPVTAARALHVTSENERTRAAAEALRTSDWETFGRLLVESHRSLRDDYEVSCPQVDRIVDYLLGCHPQAQGAGMPVLGARITGGGFGGCVLALVREDAVEDLIESLQSAGHIESPSQALTTRAAAGAELFEV